MTLQTFSRTQQCAVLCIGVIGVLVLGLQPQLLGALAADGRISEAMLGHVATIEMLAMGIGASAAGIVLARVPLRMLVVLGIALAVLCDLLTIVAGMPLLALRGGAGLAEGALIWVTIGLIVRSETPARWSAVYLISQTAMQFAVATVLAFDIVPANASTAGFGVLALVTAAGLFALPWVPRAYAPLIRSGDEAPWRVPGRGVLALCGAACNIAFNVLVWVYVEPIALAHGVSAGAVRSIAAYSLAMQILGALLALQLATKIPALPALLVVGAIDALLLGIMATTNSDGTFFVAASAFGFLWLFASPFHVMVAIQADPTRRSAELMGGAQLLGAAIGPFVGGFVMGGGDVDRILILAILLVIASSLLFVFATRKGALVDPDRIAEKPTIEPCSDGGLRG